MPRVYYVTLTKEFNVTILADSEKQVEELLDDCQHEIDRDWNPPDWDFLVQNSLSTRKIKRSEDVPKSLGEFDMAVVDDKIVSRDESGYLGEKIEELKTAAEKELTDLRLQLDLKDKQLKLPIG